MVGLTGRKRGLGRRVERKGREGRGWGLAAADSRTVGVEPDLEMGLEPLYAARRHVCKCLLYL